MSKTALRVTGLSKQYRIGGTPLRARMLRDTLAATLSAPWRAFKDKPRKDETFWALRDVSFEINQGEVVGIIGRNGAGKSTLLKILSRITEPTAGTIDIYGRVGSLLEVGTGFHPELSGRENIFLNGAILGMGRKEIETKFEEIVAFAEVEKFVDTAVKHYSSGMYLRLAFAVAAHLEPEILIIDEVLAVGDAQFQKKCLGKMQDVARQGRTVLFVSHNMAAIRSLCHQGLVLEQGQVNFQGDVGRAIAHYTDFIYAERPLVQQQAHSSGFGKMVMGSTVGANPPESRTLENGQQLEAEIEFHCPDETQGFWLYFFIEDMHGSQIVALRKDSQELDGSLLTVGTYHIRLILPPLWLRPGIYSAYFKIILRNSSTQARFVSDRYSLDFAGSSPVHDSILHPDSLWSIATRP